MTDRSRTLRPLAVAWVLSAAHVASAQPDAPVPEAPPPAAEAEPAPEAPAEPPAEAPPPEAPPPEAPPPEVVVVGARLSKLPGSVHVVSQKQLERREHDDPHAVLLSVPGVSARGEDGVGLRPNLGIRGVATDRSKKLALMEDGVLLGPAPYSAPAAYYFPLVTRMTAVRVIKGPAAIAFGPQTVGGAVDLATREIPGGASGRLDLAGGEHGYRKVHAFYGSADERSGFLLEGVHLGSSGFKELDGGGDTGFTRNEWMAKAEWTPDPTAAERHVLKLKLGYSDEESDETYLGLSDADFRANPYRRYRASALDHMSWHRTQIALSHEWGPAEEVQITTTAYRNDLSRSWRKLNGLEGASLSDVLFAPTAAQNAIYYGVLTGSLDSSTDAERLLIGPNQRDFVSQGIQTRVRWSPKSKTVHQTLEYGLRFHYDEVVRLHSEDAFDVRNGELVSAAEPTRVTADNDARTHAVALHASDSISLGALTATPGVRVEIIRTQAEDRLTDARTGSAYAVLLPGVGATYEFLPETFALGGVYRGFSPAPPGQPEVEPELSVNYEAGVRHAGRRVRASLIGFYNDYSNLTDICTFSNGCLGQDLDRQFDAGTARVFGLEASFEHDFKLGGEYYVPAVAAYTLTRGEFLSSFDSEDPQFGSVDPGDEIPYLPAHQASALVGFGAKRWEVSATGTYVGSMAEQGGSGGPLAGKRTDAHFVLDLAGRYGVLGWLELYAVAKNALDEEYLASRRPFGVRPGAPRWVQLGARLGF